MHRTDIGPELNPAYRLYSRREFHRGFVQLRHHLQRASFGISSPVMANVSSRSIEVFTVLMKRT
jgi:hypothetical protein